jgi:hypothetical protein
VYTTTVDTNGLVESLDGSIVSAEDVPEGNVALAGADRQMVFAWTKLANESPYGSFRLQVASQSDAPVVAAALRGGADDGLGCVAGGVQGGAMALLFPIVLLGRRRR